MKNKKIQIAIIAVVVIATAASSYFFLRSPWKFREDRPIKIFWLNSYHVDANPWTRAFIKGFEASFEKDNIKIEIQQFDMDAVRNASNEEFLVQKSREAKELIDDWQPDLIYATDDDAQGRVIEAYYLNTNIPVVFAGVNKDASDYNYVGSKNITGLLQREHVEGSLTLLRELFPYVRSIVTLGAPEPTKGLWTDILDQVENQEKFPDMQVIARHIMPTFEEFKEKVLFYQDKADAFFVTPPQGYLGVDGNPVDAAIVRRWLVENSNLPEVSLWGAARGTVPTEAMIVMTSIFEDGKAAGNIAKAILLDGEKPSSFGFKATLTGLRVIHLKRLKMLGLNQDQIPSVILINSKVIEKFPWDE